MENLISTITITLLQIFLCEYTLLKIANFIQNGIMTKRNILLSTVVLVISIISGTFLKEIIPFSNTVISFFMFIGSAYFIFKISIHKSLLVSIVTLSFGAITEIMCTFLAILILNIDFSDMLTTSYKLLFFLFVQILISVVLIEIATLLSHKRINLKIMFDNVSKKQLLILAIALVICIFPQMIIFILNEYSYSASFLIVNTLQFIVVCCFLFIYLKRTIDYEKSQSDLFTSELHNRTLIGMVDGVRTLKHDYNNIMQSLNGYVSTKQYDKLQYHINDVLGECSVVNNLSVIDPKIFNEPAIYGIVGSKFFLAIEDEITFDLDITTDIAKIQFPAPDSSRILGILLDNAMEATKKAVKPYIRLEMKYDKRKCADIIRVVNTYDQSVKIDLENIYKKGFSTKEVKSGIGLWEVKKLVNKQKHSQVFATIENGKFVQNLVIEKID